MIFTDWPDLIGKTIIDIKEYVDDMIRTEYSWRVFITNDGVLIEEQRFRDYPYFIRSEYHTKSTYMPEELINIVREYQCSPLQSL